MDKVRAQYERWIYPEPVEDLEVWLTGGAFSIGDARQCGDIFWPATGYREGMNILVAGCGANQAARYALQHPTAKVTGIDLSEASLAHEEKLKAKHGLDNLTLHRMRLEEVSKLGQTFDFIASSGVLHHLPDPVAGLEGAGRRAGPRRRHIHHGLRALRARAGLHDAGSVPHSRHDDTDRRGLGAGQGDDQASPERTSACTYAKRSSDMKFDAGLVDLFLHQTGPALFRSRGPGFRRDAGLAFQAWVEPMYYNPDGHVPGKPPALPAAGAAFRRRSLGRDGAVRGTAFPARFLRLPDRPATGQLHIDFTHRISGPRDTVFREQPDARREGQTGHGLPARASAAHLAAAAGRDLPADRRQAHDRRMPDAAP